MVLQEDKGIEKTVTPVVITQATPLTSGHDDDGLLPSDFCLLFESSPHPYLVLKPDAPRFTIVAVNNSYLSATGTQRQDILHRGLFEAFPDNPNDPGATGVSDLRVSLMRVIQERVQDVMGVQKYDIPRRDGAPGEFEVKYWSPVNTPVLDAEGALRFIIHRVEDVTEFILLREHATQVESVQARVDQMEAEVLRSARDTKEANRQLKAANQKLERRERELSELNSRLQELDRAKTTFFSNISHEFRTPLTLMLGPIEDTLHDAHTIPENRIRMDVAYRNVLRLLKLVNSLLDFARIEAGQSQAFYQPTNLTTLTIELASMFRAAIEKAGLKLIVDCQALPESVYVDRDMWEKIVMNLLSNAFKHTFTGEIEVRLCWKSESVELSVRDTGVGIPKEQQYQLFERFHRVPNAQARTHEGSGIGLALVYELVKLHGGAISVESQLNRGSTFTVSIPTGTAHLPAERIGGEANQIVSSLGSQPFTEEALHWLPEDQPRAAAIPSHPNRAWYKSNGEKVRVLLADDNTDMRNYVCRLLEPYCEVKTVPDGLAALAAAQEEMPDLLLSDIMMPKMDGFELLSAIRNSPSLKTLPVVLLSARADEKSRVEGLENGADDYLTKPFNAHELLARVKANLNLELHRAHQEAEQARRFSENLLASITDNVTSALMFLDTRQRCTYVNPSFERMSGYTFDEMKGQIAHDRIHHTHPNGQPFPLSECPIDRAMPRYQPVRDYEAVFIHKDGYFYDVVCNAQPIFENGKPVGTVVEIRDITEEKRVKQEIRKLNEALEQKVIERTAQLEAVNQELEAFSYSVSHDLRAPLRSIDGFSQAVLDLYADQLDPRGQDYLNRVRQGSQQMARLIDDMLNLSRLTRGTLSLEDNVDLSAIAREIADELKRQEPERQVLFDIEASVPVKGDRRLLESVLQNLLGNAWKYTSKHPTVHIQFGQTAYQGGTAYYVKDNGAGFDMAYADKLFGAFQRLHSANEFEGTGIGLATVSRIIHRHGGDVWAEGEVEKGAIFYFTLRPSL